MRQREVQMTRSFDTEMTLEADGLVLTVSGELDLSVRPQLVDQVTEALGRDGVERVTIDLDGVTFCDSSGLGALLDIKRVSTDAGAEVVLRKVPASVGRLLDLTDVDGWLTRE
jgi:anti-sigma B factor antagonist